MKYRKKPVVIDAVQWNYEGGEDAIIEWIEENDGDVVWAPDIAGPGGPNGEDWGLFSITTLEGDMEVAPYDFVIRGVAGEFYPCKPDIFARTYEAVFE